MNLFKQKKSNLKSSSKLKFAKKGFFSKKRVLPFVAIFGLLGGYLVFRSFAYTPTLNGSDGEFVPLAPARIMDTRNGNGGYSTVLPTNGTYSLQVTGRGGVPAVAGVKSVVMSVAAVSPAANGYLTVWPSGSQKPNSSNINFVAGQTIANQVTVPVGPDGKIQFFSSAGTHLIVDISGYYSSELGIPGSRYNALSPARVFDSRNGLGGYTAAIPNNGVYDVQITGQGGVPEMDVSAVVVNVVAINPTANGYATIWPAGATKPESSSLNYVNGKTIAKLVTVPLGANGKISIFNSGSATNYAFDVAGYYSSDTTPDSLKTQEGRFVSLNPARIMDTRNNLGGYSVAIPANGTYSLTVKGRGGLPENNVKAVVVNITAVSPSANGFLTAWPSGVPKPNASNVNFVKGQSTANQAILLVGSDGKIQLSSSASTNIIVDVAGYFIDYEDQFVQTFVGGSIVKYKSDGGLQFIDESTIGQISFDLNIKELPAKGNGRVSYRNYISSESGSSYADYKLHSIEINYIPNDATASIFVQCFDDCQTLSTPINSFDGLTYKNYSFNYSLLANKSYTISREVLPVQDGYTGRRLVTSVLVDGVKTNLITEKLSDVVNLRPSANIATMLEGYSCKSTNTWGYDIGNVKINGAGGYSIFTNGPVYEENPFYIANCSGYVKAQYSPEALSEVYLTTANGSPIISSDMQSIMGFNLGIPAEKRDTLAPVITNVQQQPTVCNDQPAVLVTFDGSDNGLVASTGYINLSTPDYNYGSDDLYLANGQVQQLLCSWQFATGTHNLQLIVKDDSGNDTTYPITIVMP